VRSRRPILKKAKDGLRAEQIREELQMQAKEMPRILKEGSRRRTQVQRTKARNDLHGNLSLTAPLVSTKAIRMASKSR
jgi:hypothetical protein